MDTHTTDFALVTGGSGSLGGALAVWLAQQGVRVRALARSPEKAAFLRPYEAIEVAQGDLLDADSLRRAAQGCRYVFHCAAATSGKLEAQYPVNVEGTRNTARAAAEAGAERLVHISTLSVYGYRENLYEESMPPQPGVGAYSLTKAQGEQALCESARESGLSYAIIRPGAIYGPRTHWTRGIYKLARRRPILFIGQGTGNMPLIYIDDLLEMCWLCATTAAAHGEAFNAAFAPQPSMKRALLAFAALAGPGRYAGLPAWPIKAIARGLAAVTPAGSDYKILPEMLRMLTEPICYPMEKARRLLGWQPQVDVEEGVQKSIPWMREVGML